MKNLMQHLMVSCRKATGLIEKKKFTKLSVIEKIKLSFHTSMCTACREYQKQSELIEKLLRNHFNSESPASSENISLKTKIINSLRKEK